MAKKVVGLNEPAKAQDPPSDLALKEPDYVGLTENTCLYLVMQYRTTVTNRDTWELNVCRVLDFSLQEVKVAHAELVRAILESFPELREDADFKKKSQRQLYHEKILLSQDF